MKKEHLPKFNFEKFAKDVISEAQKQRSIQKEAEEFSQKYDINCHILSCRKDFRDLLLSLTSFYVFSRKYVEIYVHEDGSFRRKEFETLNSVFPFVNVVKFKDTTKLLAQDNIFDNEILKRRNEFWYLPQAIKKRLKQTYPHKLTLKLTDFPINCNKHRMMSFDSDTLFFNPCNNHWTSIEKGKEFILLQDEDFEHNKRHISHSLDVLTKISKKYEKARKFYKGCIGISVVPAQFIKTHLELLNTFLVLAGKNNYGISQGFYTLFPYAHGFKPVMLPKSKYLMVPGYEKNWKYKNQDVVHGAQPEIRIELIKRICKKYDLREKDYF